MFGEYCKTYFTRRNRLFSLSSKSFYSLFSHAVKLAIFCWSLLCDKVTHIDTYNVLNHNKEKFSLSVGKDFQKKSENKPLCKAYTLLLFLSLFLGAKPKFLAVFWLQLVHCTSVCVCLLLKTVVFSN